MRHLTATVLAVLVLALAGCGTKPAPSDSSGSQAPKPAAKKQLAMGATGATSGAYVYYVTAAKVVNDKVPGANVTVVETGATVDNLKRLAKGDIDLGLVTVETGYSAWKGEDSWKANPMKDLRVLWIYEDTPQNYVVTQSSGVQSIYDLNGKEFNPGLSGSASEKLSEKAFEILGIKPKWYRGSNADVVDAIKDRRIVGLAKTGWSDSSIKDIQATQAVRILGFSPEDEKKIRAAIPFVVWMDVPANTYKGVPAYRTFGIAISVSATSKLDNDLVYQMVKAAVENNEEIAKAYPLVKGRNVAEFTLKNAPYPLHAGTVKYLKEKGLTVPENLIPPEARK